MEPLDDSLHMLRLSLDHKAPAHSVLAVSAAKRGEGTTYLACGLARAFAEAGYPTLLIDANPAVSGIDDELECGIAPVLRSGHAPSARATSTTRLAVLSLGREGTTGPIMREMLANVAAAYRITIVDAPPLVGSSFALEVARSADRLLLAVRLGRKPVRADRELRKTLETLEDKLLGIVPTHATDRPRPARPEADFAANVISGRIPAPSKRSEAVG